LFGPAPAGPACQWASADVCSRPGRWSSWVEPRAVENDGETGVRPAGRTTRFAASPRSSAAPSADSEAVPQSWPSTGPPPVHPDPDPPRAASAATGKPYSPPAHPPTLTASALSTPAPPLFGHALHPRPPTPAGPCLSGSARPVLAGPPGPISRPARPARPARTARPSVLFGMCT
jgi:hypothetical protein